jgi:hypothetical protein
MTTPPSKLPPSTDASPANPVCQHGVSLSLDDDPHCFECSKMATAYGLPANARMMNYPNALAFTAMLKNKEAVDGTPAPATVYSRPEGTTDTVDFTVRTPTGLERLMNDIRAQQTEDVKLSGGQRMLERVVVQLRAELTEASQDRDDFAAENLDLLQRQGNDANRIDQLEAELSQQKIATDIQKANYMQMARLYNNALAGTVADIVRERNGLAHSVEELRKDLTNVQAERDALKAKQAEIMAVVTRFG